MLGLDYCVIWKSCPNALTWLSVELLHFSEDKVCIPKHIMIVVLWAGGVYGFQMYL